LPKSPRPTASGRTLCISAMASASPIHSAWRSAGSASLRAPSANTRPSTRAIR